MVSRLKTVDVMIESDAWGSNPHTHPSNGVPLYLFGVPSDEWTNKTTVSPSSFTKAAFLITKKPALEDRFTMFSELH